MSEFKPLPKGFREGLKYCSKTLEKSDWDTDMNLIYVSGNKMFSRDEHRESCYQIDEEAEFQIPYWIVDRLLDEHIEGYAVADYETVRSVHFKISYGILSIQFPIPDEYAVEEFHKIFEEYQGVEIFLPDISDALKRCKTVQSNHYSGDCYVELSFDKEQLTIKSKEYQTHPKLGWFVTKDNKRSGTVVNIEYKETVSTIGAIEEQYICKTDNSFEVLVLRDHLIEALGISDCIRYDGGTLMFKNGTYKQIVECT